MPASLIVIVPAVFSGRPSPSPGLPRRGRRRSSKDHEKSPRDWYGGAVGLLDFDSNMNTELTLRTIRVKDGIAQVRAARLYCTTPIRELLGPQCPFCRLADISRERTFESPLNLLVFRAFLYGPALATRELEGCPIL